MEGGLRGDLWMDLKDRGKKETKWAFETRTLL